MKILFRAAVALLSVATLSFFTGCGAKTEPPRGELANTVVLVNFANGDTFSSSYAADANDKLNLSPTGMKEFFKAESLGRQTVTSFIAGVVTAENPASYYFEESLANPGGYDAGKTDGKSSVDAFFREQTLVREILDKVVFPENYNADLDGDGYADGLTFVFNAEFASSGQQIMWPHKSEFYGVGVLDTFYVPDGYFNEGEAEEALSARNINGARAYRYAIVTAAFTTGQICHEFSHVLGLPDYYSYVKTGLFPKNDNIGKYELLGASPGEIPQYSLAYVRSKLGWLEEGRDIEVVSSTREITLSPVTAGGVQAIKITPAGTVEKGEFFMAEVRRKESGGFDDAVNSTGVIIYSVVPENAYIGEDGNFGPVDLGNMYGNGRFEVKLLTSGPFNYFTSSAGRNVASLSYSDGASAGVSVEAVSENADGSFTLSVTFSESARPAPYRPKLIKKAGGNALAIEWQAEDLSGSIRVVAFKADSRSAAAFATDNLPDAKSVVSGDYGAFTAMEVYDFGAASGFAFLKSEAERVVVVVETDGDGNVVSYSKFRFTLGGSVGADYTFADVLAVSFAPGKPAFIAGCAIIGLCVLAGIIIAVTLKVRGFGKGKRGV
ncbi:MAG: immune inhibitor A [Clostridia bacterium]|nr:immune inhibitor A [Clostridia bacterium]